MERSDLLLSDGEMNAAAEAAAAGSEVEVARAVSAAAAAKAAWACVDFLEANLPPGSFLVRELKDELERLGIQRPKEQG